MTKFINLTPHEISVIDENGNTIKLFQPSGYVLRLVQKRDIELCAISQWFEPENIETVMYRPIDEELELDKPELIQDKDAVYIVSNPIAKFMKNPRFQAPDTMPESALRDENGNIIGVRRLCFYA